MADPETLLSMSSLLMCEFEQHFFVLAGSGAVTVNLASFQVILMGAFAT